MRGRRHRLLIRGSKWAATAAALSVAALWALSGWRWVSIGAWNGYFAATVDLRHGGLWLVAGRAPHDAAPEWSFTFSDEYDEPRYWRWDAWQFYPSKYRLLFLGLWVPFVVLAGISAVLWSCDRRPRRPGHCPCGYSRAGLADNSPCPECGRVPEGRLHL